MRVESHYSAGELADLAWVELRANVPDTCPPQGGAHGDPGCLLPAAPAQLESKLGVKFTTCGLRRSSYWRLQEDSVPHDRCVVDGA